MKLVEIGVGLWVNPESISGLKAHGDEVYVFTHGSKEHTWRIRGASVLQVGAIIVQATAEATAANIINDLRVNVQRSLELLAAAEMAKNEAQEEIDALEARLAIAEMELRALEAVNKVTP